MKLRDFCHDRHELTFIESAPGNDAVTATAVAKLLWLLQRRLAKAATERRTAYKRYLKEARKDDDAANTMKMLDLIYDQAVTEARSVANLAAAQVKALRAGAEITPIADATVTFELPDNLEEALAAHPAHQLEVPPGVLTQLGLDADGNPLAGAGQTHQ